MAQNNESSLQGSSDAILAKLAIKSGLATKEQVTEALNYQRELKKSGIRAFLAKILVQQGTLTEKQIQYLVKLHEFLSTRQEESAFIQAALSKRMVTRAQVDQAAKEQVLAFKKSLVVKSIAAILVENDVLSERQKEELLQELYPPAQAAVSSSEESALSDSAEADDDEDDEDDEDDDDEDEDDEPELGDEEEERDYSSVRALDSYFTVEFSDDRKKAFLNKFAQPPEVVEDDEIEDFLAWNGIRHGIEISEKILNEINDRNSKVNRWLVAQATPPVPSQDAVIKYHFDTDNKKIGTVKSGGAIDFRDRGETPMIKEGTLLAERTPPVRGEPGMDLFGGVITVDPPKDRKLISGKGVELDETRNRAYAKRTGRPELTPYGKLYVHAEHVIKGDVNMETGNVTFDGIINVHGAVEDGFKIKGGKLLANEVRKAEVEVNGDVVVYGGIVGAKVVCNGLVRARYIQGAVIEAGGDVAAEVLIVNSRIQTSGAISARTGKILSSNLTARKGVEAGQIGSDKSRPCSFHVGVDLKLEQKLQGLKETIESKEELRVKMEESLEEQRNKAAQHELKIGEAAQKQEMVMRKLNQIAAEMKKVPKSASGAPDPRLEQIERHKESLEREMAESEKVMEGLFEQENEIKEEASKISDSLNVVAEEIEGLQQEIAYFEEWSESNPVVPAVKAYNSITAGTQIKGPHCATVLERPVRNSTVRESRPDEEEEGKAGSAWQIRIVPNP